MVVLVQPMPWLRTGAFTMAVPAGVAHEPARHAGLASLVCEMVQRGAGSYSSRDLVAVQDRLGIERGGGVTTSMTSFGAAMPAESFAEGLRLYADIVRRPHLPIDQLEDARQVGMQELRAIEDEPTHRVMRRLRQLQYGDVLGRSVSGTVDGLQAITSDDVRQYYETTYHSAGAILGIAGNVDVDEVMALAETLFGDWRSGSPTELPQAGGAPGYEHIELPSSQTHIGFSFPTIPYGSPDYFAMRAGIGILSDGMSSRLFDRVREQRGLCYTVSASVHNLPQTAAVFGYAGTTPARAQETWDVTHAEIIKLTEDLQASELARWQVRIESSLVMEQESASSRASSLVADQQQIGRPQPTAELQGLIENLTLDQVRDYWNRHPAGDFRVVTLGEGELVVGQS